MIKLRDLLKEIGETTDYYTFSGPHTVFGDLAKGMDGHVEYYFRADDGDQYIVEITWDKEIKSDGSFTGSAIVDFISSKTSYSAKGLPLTSQTFKVISTVIRVMQAFIKANPWVNMVMFNVEDEKKPDTRSKENLYLAFIKKQLPSVRVERGMMPGQYKIYL